MPPSRAAVSPKRQTLTIVLTGGGSGGHITPLLSLARELKRQKPQCKIIYIGLKGEKVEGLQSRYQVFDQVCTVTAGKFRRYHGQSFLAYLVDIDSLLLNIRDIFKVIGGFFSARRLLRKIKPDLVFSKGSFVAVPVGLAAKTLKIPIVTHDSDAVPGLANRLIGKKALVHTTGLPAENYDYLPNTVVEVGIPTDERLKPVTPKLQQQYKDHLGLPADSQVLLVGGAGLGSQTINSLIISAAPEMLSQLPKLYIIHLTGAKHRQAALASYKASLEPNLISRLTVLDFTPDFYLYTGASDLVVTRAGATTLAELAVQAKACILIPAPFLTGGHQLKNAENLNRREAVKVLPDNVSTEEFSKLVLSLLKNDDQRLALAKKMGSLAKADAAARLANLLLELASQVKSKA